jgi:hypothetical protein
MLSLITGARAEDRPFHVEANVGRSSVDDIDGLSIDDAATAFRLETGYRFFDWLGVAGAFVDLGTIESSVEITPGALAPVKASADGFEVTVVGRAELTEKWAIAAHAGMLWWTGDASINGVVNSDSGNDSTWGIGAEYELKQAIVLTAGRRRYVVDDIDVDAAYLGVMVRFGDTE